MNPKLYQFLVGVFASTGSVLYGYDLGVIAGVIGAPSFLLEFDASDDETYVQLKAVCEDERTDQIAVALSCPSSLAVPSSVQVWLVLSETGLAESGLSSSVL